MPGLQGRRERERKRKKDKGESGSGGKEKGKEEKEGGKEKRDLETRQRPWLCLYPMTLIGKYAKF